jgi:putative DNA primase/helicase
LSYSINKIAEIFGGEVTGGEALVPGPGHSAKDRSLAVRLDDKAPDGFLVHSFASDDAIVCRDYVRQRLGLPKFEPKGGVNGGAKPFSPTVAKYTYRLADGTPYLQVHRLADKSGFPQYHWDGEKWISGKPKGPKVPYMLPELIAAGPAMPIYIVEGEKDADNLVKLGFVATCNSEGADNGSGKKWTSDLNQYFANRDVFIIPDNDAQGRKHAEHVARNLDPVAKSVRIVELPGLPPKGDASDWLRSDTAGAKLAKLAAAAPLWKASADEAAGDPADDPDDAAIERLAKLPTLDYERERKDAAKALGIRASILERLVKAKRVELGLDEGGALQGSAVLFPEPEPWADPVEGAALLDAIANAIGRHVVMPAHSRDLTALWVVHTYLLDVFLISPRLGIRSPVRRCGKTTLLDVLTRLVLRALAAANATAAAIFRVIEAHRPTLLIDEADTFLPGNDDVRGILNSGHRYGGSVLRTVGDNHEPRAFGTYGACAIALIGQLPGTLTDRAIAIDLKRRLPSEPIEPFRLDRTGHLDVLARQIARWGKDHAEEIRAADPPMPVGIFNREADNLRPLLAIADVAGGEWPERARKAAVQGRDTGDEDDGSRLELLLGDIRDAFAESSEMSSADLVDALVAIEGSPWAELGKSCKPLTQNRLARMLKPLGIGPWKIGPRDARLSGYIRVHFKEAFGRYLGPDGVSQPDTRTQCDEIRTSDIFKPDATETGCPVVKLKKPNNDGLVSGCPVAKGGFGEKGDFGEKSMAGGRDEPGLSQRRLKEIASWYVEEVEHRRAGGADLDPQSQADLDGWLRRVLREEDVFPEFLEIEFQRVMEEIFKT